MSLSHYTKLKLQTKCCCWGGHCRLFQGLPCKRKCSSHEFVILYVVQTHSTANLSYWFPLYAPCKSLVKWKSQGNFEHSCVCLTFRGSTFSWTKKSIIFCYLFLQSVWKKKTRLYWVPRRTTQKAAAVCLSVWTSLMLTDWLEADKDSAPQTNCLGVYVLRYKLTWMNLKCQQRREGLKSKETLKLTYLNWQQQPPPQRHMHAHTHTQK